jgi:hypothetical protein
MSELPETPEGLVLGWDSTLLQHSLRPVISRTAAGLGTEWEFDHLDRFFCFLYLCCNEKAQRGSGRYGLSELRFVSGLPTYLPYPIRVSAFQLNWGASGKSMPHL